MQQVIIRLKTLTALTLLLTFITVYSCKKEDKATASDEEVLVMSEENAEASADFDDIAEIGLSVSSDVDGIIGGAVTNNETPGINSPAGNPFDFRLDLFKDLLLKTGRCANVTVTPNDSTFPKTVTIDFGTGCGNGNGKFRSGKIILNYTAPIRKPGAVLTITFNNFQLNRKKIEGTKIITNKSTAAAPDFNIIIQNGKVTWPNGRGFTYDANKILQQVSGMNTPIIRDDVYHITGNTKTLYNNGVTVLKNTATPLVKAVSCHWISDGILQLDINNRQLSIDYSASKPGACDNKALLKWANGQRLINLPL
jgi:hypothetical protein